MKVSTAMAIKNLLPAIPDGSRALALIFPILFAASCSRTPSAPPPAAGTPSADAELSEPANPAFIGRVWVATTQGSPRGSMLVFLPDRSLLMDSCFETYRISKWGVAGDRIRWLEDTIPIEAEVKMPSPNELTLQVAGQDRAQTYVAASVPFVCPDMPR